MKYQDLPVEYKSLCFQRIVEFCTDREEASDMIAKNNGQIVLLFDWLSTPEGDVFWSEVDAAKSFNKLPPLSTLSTVVYDDIQKLYPIY